MLFLWKIPVTDWRDSLTLALHLDVEAFTLLASSLTSMDLMDCHWSLRVSEKGLSERRKEETKW